MTAVEQTNPYLVGKNKNHFIISHSFLAQESWQFGWVIFLFHVALLRSLVGVQLAGGPLWRNQAGFTHMSSNFKEPEGRFSWDCLPGLRHMSSSVWWPPRLTGPLQGHLRIPRVGVLVHEAETSWPLMT